MPGGLTLASVAGLFKGWGPWVGVAVLAFYVGGDRTAIDKRMDSLAHDDTVNMTVIHGALRELKVGQDSLAAGQRQLTCYVLNNRSPGCARWR